MRRKNQRGQALILVLVALSIFLIGAIGLAIDGSHLYAQRQMAQATADAAAQAAIMSILDHTNLTAPVPFNPAAGAFNCAVGDGRTPCVFAARNGFNLAGDTVTVSFPNAVAGVGAPSPDYPFAFAQATITRTVDTTLMKFLGSASSSIKALAVAAIVQTLSPVPIIVTHPTLPGSFRIGGNPLIRICGGPARSIQVNSNSTTSLSTGGTAQVDLSKAGPADDGTCSTGTGADFGDFGGPTSPGSPPAWLNPVGTTEHFLQPASPILDPLSSVPPPPNPGSEHVANVKYGLANGVNGCPAAPPKPCTLYHPGLYTGGIDVKNETAVFMPGVYWMDGGGFGNAANGLMLMSTGFGNDPDTGQGMLVYNSGTSASIGTFNVGANSGANLVGTPINSIYKGILFFQDRNSPRFVGPGPNKAHTLGGGGDLILNGTIYLTNCDSNDPNCVGNTMTAGLYQDLELRGNSGNTTLIEGEIIVSSLDLGGGGTIQMNLNPNLVLPVNQVALVK